MISRFYGISTSFKPTVRWLYKDITYETIHNLEFRRTLESQLGKHRADIMVKEYDAAPAQPPLSPILK